MKKNRRVLGVIPARGGSKGVERKNLRVVAGKSLIAYTIETAQRSQYLDRVIVSSEDSEILEESARHGAEPLLRPRHLAADDTPGVVPALHAIDALPGFDIVVLLQPTSPLRVSSDIDGCIDGCMAAEETCCVSLVEAEQSPYWMFSMNSEQRLQPVTGADVGLIARRQELPTVYRLNGAVYAAGTDWLRRHGSFVEPGVAGWIMPAERSLDIDSEADIDHFCQVVSQSGGKIQ